MAAINHPWNPLPVEEAGDADPTTLFAAVGRALSAWEVMEGMLGQAFAMLCRAEFEGAERAYGVVSSFSGRKDMLMEAFRCFPQRTHERVKPFPKLLDRIQDFSSRRNEIAHGVVLEISHDNRGPDWYLIPALYNSRKRASRTAFIEENVNAFTIKWHHQLKYAYNSKQVDYYRNQFGGLAADVGSILGGLATISQDDFQKKLGDRHRA